MIAFCGYLLAFNKITGLAFYVCFLLTMGLYEMLTSTGKYFWQKIYHWWNWKKVLLWVAPAVVFLMTMVLGDDLTIQNFYGSYTGGGIGGKPLHEMLQTFMQSFVYGFRWLFVLSIIIAIILLLFRRRRIVSVVSPEGILLLTGSFVGCIGVLLTLCLYKGDADCPRYTALLNLFYALSFPVAVQIIMRNNRGRHILASGMALLLLIQTFWTIDPVILFTSDRINTGKKNMYKLALRDDHRPGMNIGKDYGPGYEVICDLYTYNLEYNFYDDLLDQALMDIQPNEDTQFVQLDVMWYETHLFGNKYRIYWNTRTQGRTYDGKDPDSIFLKQRDAFTEEICNGGTDFGEKFYLLVPARVNPLDAITAFEEHGYNMVYEFHPQNIYGKMHVCGFELK